MVNLIPELPYSKTLLPEIDPKDLGIGNIVYRRSCTSDKGGHLICRHIPMALDEQWLRDFPNCTYPIQLTAEMLKKVGWEIVDQGKGPYWWNKRAIFFHILENEYGYFISWNGNGLYLKSLHQLQNL